MAIAFDAQSFKDITTTDSFTHTPVGAPKAVFVLIAQTTASTDRISQVNYGGVPMTRVANGIAQDTANEAGAAYIYFLGSGVPAGVKNIAITVTAGTEPKTVWCVTFTASGDCEIVTTNRVQNDAANPSVTLATPADFIGAAINVLYSGLATPADATITAGTGYTKLTGSSAGGRDFGNQAATAEYRTGLTGANVASGWTSANDDVAMVAAAFDEAARVARISWAQLGAPFGVVGQATSTSIAQAITRKRSRSLTQPSEADTAQAITRLASHTITIGQVSETDSALRFANVLRQASETDTSQPISRKKTRAVGQNSETDLSQTITRNRRKTTGQTTEVDSVFSISKSKKRTLGQNTETDLAQTLVGGNRVSTGQSSETDTAQPISRKKSGNVGIVPVDYSTGFPTANGILYTGDADWGKLVPSDSGDLEVVSNHVRNNGAGVVGRTYMKRGQKWLNVDVEFDITTLPLTNNSVSLLARISDAGTSVYDKYELSIYNVGSGLFSTSITVQMNGGFTLILAQSAAEFAITAPTRIRFRVYGNQLEGWVNLNGAWVLKCSVTDSTLTSAGEVGMTVADTTSVAVVDNFTANAVQEADFAQSPVRLKSRAMAQASETETSQPITPVKRPGIGQASTTNIAQAITRKRSRAVGQPFTTETATTILLGGRAVRVTWAQIETPSSTNFYWFLGQPLESDSAQVITRKVSHALGQVSETDFAQNIDPVFPRRASLTTETDTAQHITARRSRTLGQISETDLVFLVHRSRSLAVGQSLENDVPQAIIRGGAFLRRIKVTWAQVATPTWTNFQSFLGQPSTLNEAQQFSHKKAHSVAQVVETDLSQPVIRRGQTLQASETDLAQPIRKLMRVALNQVTEIDTPGSVHRSARPVKSAAGLVFLFGDLGGVSLTVGQASSASIAQPISRMRSRGLVMGFTNNIAQPITRSKKKGQGQTSETDLAQPLTIVGRSRDVNQTSETDTAQAIARKKTLALAQASDSEIANAVQSFKQRIIGQLVENDSAQTIRRVRPQPLGQVSEIDEVFAFNAKHFINLGIVTEADLAQRFSSIGTVFLSQPEEIETAFPITYASYPPKARLIGVNRAVLVKVNA